MWVTQQHFGLVSNRTNVGSCKQRFPIATYGAPTPTTAFEQVYGVASSDESSKQNSSISTTVFSKGNGSHKYVYFAQ